MDEKSFFRSLDRVRRFLDEVGLLRDARDRKSFEPPPQLKAAAKPEFTYGRLFRIGLESAAYTHLLEDFSFFQFSFKQHKDHYSARFAYYPNPFVDDSSMELLREIAEGTTSDRTLEDFSQVMSEVQENVRVPMIRYEVDSPAYRELAHPYAHVHLGTDSDNRWGVAIELTPCVFAHQITKMFYPRHWSKGKINEGESNRWDVQLIDLKRGCAPVPAERFSQSERNQLHFA